MHSIDEILGYGVQVLTKVAEDLDAAEGPSINISDADRGLIRKALTSAQYMKSAPQFRDIGMAAGGGVGALYGGVKGYGKGGAKGAILHALLGTLGGGAAGRFAGGLGARGYATARGFTGREKLIDKLDTALSGRGIDPSQYQVGYKGMSFPHGSSPKLQLTMQKLRNRSQY